MADGGTGSNPGSGGSTRQLGDFRSDRRLLLAAMALARPGIWMVAAPVRLPVTDPASGRLVGLITRKDLLQVRAALVPAEGERQVFFGRTRLPRA